ncbi:hypothetical protein QQP08_007393 [Theobroma cacao]|nr:hypothetical protein QQP08_007393 [Theobroma cacao]
MKATLGTRSNGYCGIRGTIEALHRSSLSSMPCITSGGFRNSVSPMPATLDVLAAGVNDCGGGGGGGADADLVLSMIPRDRREPKRRTQERTLKKCKWALKSLANEVDGLDPKALVLKKSDSSVTPQQFFSLRTRDANTAQAREKNLGGIKIWTQQTRR